MFTCTHVTLQGKEVIALDADDHLAPSVLMRFDVSELRLPWVHVDRLPSRNLLLLCAA